MSDGAGGTDGHGGKGPDRAGERAGERERERRRDSRRPPRSLQVAVAVGLGLVLVAIAALGVAVYLDGAAPGGLDVPRAELQFSYDGETGTLAVEHVGGPAYTTENTAGLYVAVNGTARETVTLPFGPGERHVLEDVPAGQEVALVWVAEGGEEERTVSSTVVGESE